MVITVKTENVVKNNAGNLTDIKEEEGQQSIQTSSKENSLDKTEATVETKYHSVDKDSNIKETDTQMSREANSSDKTEVTVETKKDAVNEDSNNKETNNEKNTQMPGESLSKGVEVPVEMKNDAENDQNKDSTSKEKDSEQSTHVSGVKNSSDKVEVRVAVNEDSTSKEKDSEQSTHMSGVKNSSDKVEVRVAVNEDSTSKEKNSEQSTLMSGAVVYKDSVDDDTNKEDHDINKSSGKVIETSREANSSNEAEVNNVITPQVGNKDKDVADGSLKPEDNEEDSTKAT